MNTHRFNQWLRTVQTLSVPRIRPKILRNFWHDSGAYTQGLAFHEGRLFESTGLREKSSLREINPSDGHVIRRLDVTDDFAEGICIRENCIYQLMWQSGRMLRYDVQSFSVIGEARITHEGWGIASIGAFLVVSDGTSVLRRYDSAISSSTAFRARTGGVPLRHLNALCASEERLYANIWYSNLIAEIDPTSGRVTRMIDCSELAAIESPMNEHCVQNGIAYDAANRSFYLTGKHWRNYFEVALPI